LYRELPGASSKDTCSVVPASCALEHQEMPILAGHPQKHLIAVRGFHPDVVCESFEYGVEVVSRCLGLQSLQMEFVEHKKCRCRLGFVVGRGVPTSTQELNIVVLARPVIAGTEIEIDPVNAIIVDDNEVSVPCLAVGAPLARQMMPKLNTQPELLQGILEKIHSVPFLACKSVESGRQSQSITHVDYMQWVVGMPVHATSLAQKHPTRAFLTTILWVIRGVLAPWTLLRRIPAPFAPQQLDEKYISPHAHPFIHSFVLWWPISVS
jgi:hypothetical protein